MYDKIHYKLKKKKGFGIVNKAEIDAFLEKKKKDYFQENERQNGCLRRSYK